MIDEAAAVALTAIRRVLIEGQQLSYDALAAEAAVVYETDREHALARLDEDAASVGVGSLVMTRR